jgi:hypothetical protein
MRSEGPCRESDLETVAMANAASALEVVDFIVLSGMYERPFFHRAAARGVLDQGRNGTVACAGARMIGRRPVKDLQ